MKASVFQAEIMIMRDSEFECGAETKGTCKAQDEVSRITNEFKSMMGLFGQGK